VRLSQAGALDDHCGDCSEQGTVSEPVGGREGLGGESAMAAGAAEPLDAHAIAGALEEAVALGVPARLGVMAGAAGVGAEGRPEGTAPGVRESTKRVHTLRD